MIQGLVSPSSSWAHYYWRFKDNKQILHAFLFNIRHYSTEVINIQRVEYYITEGELFRY